MGLVSVYNVFFFLTIFLVETRSPFKTIPIYGGQFLYVLGFTVITVRSEFSLSTLKFDCFIDCLLPKDSIR